VSKCVDLETSTKRRPRPELGCGGKERKKERKKEDGFSLDLIYILNKSVDAFKTIMGTLHKYLDSSVHARDSIHL